MISILRNDVPMNKTKIISFQTNVNILLFQFIIIIKNRTKTSWHSLFSVRDIIIIIAVIRHDIWIQLHSGRYD